MNVVDLYGKLPDVIRVCLGPLVTKLCAHVNLYHETDKYFIQKFCEYKIRFVFNTHFCEFYFFNIILEMWNQMKNNTMIKNGLENVCVQPQNLDIRMGKILEV